MTRSDSIETEVPVGIEYWVLRKEWYTLCFPSGYKKLFFRINAHVVITRITTWPSFAYFRIFYTSDRAQLTNVFFNFDDITGVQIGWVVIVDEVPYACKHG